MTIGFPRFGLQFASGGIVTALTPAQAAAGWAFLGTSPPTVEEFNAMMQTFDDKDNWLFNNILYFSTTLGSAAPADGVFTALYNGVLALFQATGSGNSVGALAGTATVYTLTNAQPLATAYANGQRFRATVNVANGVNPTLNVDGKGAIPIYGAAATALTGGEMPINSIASFQVLISATVNGGNPVAILGDAAGGPRQTAPAVAAAHAVQFGQIQTQAGTAFTAAGVAPAYTLTPSPALTAYAAPQRFRVKFTANGTLGSNTLNINGLGAIGLYQYDGAGNLVPATILAGMLSDVEYNGTQMVVLDPLTSSFGVAGQVRNLKASLTAAGTSLTVTADEILLETALGGAIYKCANFNQVVSTTAVGIGGVVGAALTASGYAAIYGAFNPTTGAQGAFLVNANAAVGSIAAAPPAGWIATGLIGFWILNSSTQLIPGFLLDRALYWGGTSILSTASTVASLTLLSIASAVPPNARTVDGNLTTVNSAAGAGMNVSFAGTIGGIPGRTFSVSTPTANSGISAQFSDVPLITAQTMFYATAPVGSGTVTTTAIVNKFTF